MYGEGYRCSLSDSGIFNEHLKLYAAHVCFCYRLEMLIRPRLKTNLMCLNSGGGTLSLKDVTTENIQIQHTNLTFREASLSVCEGAGTLCCAFVFVYNASLCFHVPMLKKKALSDTVTTNQVSAHSEGPNRRQEHKTHNNERGSLTRAE